MARGGRPRAVAAGAYAAMAGNPRAVAVTTAAGIAAGGLAWAGGRSELAELAWALVTALALVPLAVGVARDLLRREPGVDVIALLAMAGALALGQALAGAVVALMLAGGQALEAYADARARRELSALLARAPRSTRRYRGGELESIAVEDVRRGDVLLVGPGEVVPVDGAALAATVLDEAALTGEARPVERSAGAPVRSGAVNAGRAFDLRAVTTAEESTYAGIVRLVREAQSAKAPFVRLADRYALVFLPLALAVAAGAWAASGDPVRALAVLVVATPCPLILAAPVAIVAGISREARRGVIVKGGGALETLARARVVLLDKTGTLTTGAPRVSDVEVFGSWSPDELLRLAASLDRVSPHVFAPAIVSAATLRGLAPSLPVHVEEVAGAGIRGVVDGRRVALGRATWVAGGRTEPPGAAAVRRRAAAEGGSTVFVAVDGELAGALLLEDPVRGDSPRAIRRLRRAGVRRVVVVTGDLPDVGALVGAAVGADAVLAEQTPAEKVEAVRRERAGGVTVMVGDGVNDAPALAAADVGVAMGARGATASSEAADVVMAVDRLDRLAEGLAIARRARTIAVQSVVAGMALSIAAMVVAAAGFLPPVAGAVLQEGIDVLVILNALRALAGPMHAGDGRVELPAGMGDGHVELLPIVDRVRRAADRLGELPPAEERAELEELRRLLAERLLPHEAADDAALYPAVARVIGGADPTGPMSRAHVEIRRLAGAFARLVDELPETGPSRAELRDLRRVLYGLHAVLRLHFAQEDESYLSLFEPDERPRPAPAGPGGAPARL
ncbi:MAG TPA: heavy metal translocating P-type ATPase [Candidatus Dormibacteraeota bacterium]|nr:heavy metal translocating P-type ATPase [Candidatus Dormibacteraeota bacterium]